MIERSSEFITAGLYLSRCGVRQADRDPLPPHHLGTTSWAIAYAMFFDALGAGRSLRAFHNSLKATRDQFDSHVESGRRGWRLQQRPKPLPPRDLEILGLWSGRPDDELWASVRTHADLQLATLPASILSDLASEPHEEDETVRVGREGKLRAVISRRRERSPRLRAEALRIHGSDCQVCGFSFENAYGSWGRGFAEVHHIEMLGAAPAPGRETDPSRDLTILCSNCHRMIHRKRGQVLTLEELRARVRGSRSNAGSAMAGPQRRGSGA